MAGNELSKKYIYLTVVFILSFTQKFWRDLFFPTQSAAMLCYQVNSWCVIFDGSPPCVFIGLFWTNSLSCYHSSSLQKKILICQSSHTFTSYAQVSRTAKGVNVANLGVLEMK